MLGAVPILLLKTIKLPMTVTKEAMAPTLAEIIIEEVSEVGEAEVDLIEEVHEVDMAEVIDNLI